MKMYRLFLLAFPYAAFILFMSCKDESAPTKPPEGLVPDTTSHEFVWDKFTFGGANGSSRLRDVFVINENEVWAVGEIHTEETDRFDSLGNWVDPYNVVHWDGDQWKLERFYTTRNGNKSIILPIRGIWVFGPNNIWLAAGSIYHWDGKTAELTYQRDLNSLETVESIWCASARDIYGVGNQGLIVHYDSASWQKLESGTNLDIQDVWGIVDAKTQEKIILCAASDKYHSSEMKIIRILPQNVVGEFDWTPQRKVHSLWFREPTRIYACGSGFFMYENDQWQQDETLPTIFKNRIRANHRNDLFLAGDFGLLTHYNGKSWRVYDSLGLPQGNYEGLAVKDDLVVAVGWNGDRAVVLRRVRTN